MKHTPGPWESLDDCVRVNRPGDPDHHIMVCSIPPYLTGSKENAASIAAVPEMFNALIQAFGIIMDADWFIDPFENKRFCDTARGIFGKLTRCRLGCLGPFETGAL